MLKILYRLITKI